MRTDNIDPFVLILRKVVWYLSYERGAHAVVLCLPSHRSRLEPVWFMLGGTTMEANDAQRDNPIFWYG